MSKALDMSLDDIIRSNRQSAGRSHRNFRDGRGYGRGSGYGPERRFPPRAQARSEPYPSPQMVQLEQMLSTGGTPAESGTKLYISNLDYGVSNQDIKVLFSDVGELKHLSIHYDRSGRSKGTAEVVFVRQSDALAAIRRYNNIHLDGQPMQIEMVGVNIASPPKPLPTSGTWGYPTGYYGRQERFADRGWHHGGGRGSGRGRGRGRGRGGKISSEDLDADLEHYHLEALKNKRDNI